MSDNNNDNKNSSNSNTVSGKDNVQTAGKDNDKAKDKGAGKENKRPYVALTVSPKAERAIRAGHPWVYGEEVRPSVLPDGVKSISGAAGGDIVDVYSERGAWLGAGFINDISKIRVRLITRNTNDRPDRAFWERRVRYTVAYRRRVMGTLSSCRLIFGEADRFPGLTVDKFGDLLSVQVLCLGTERIKDMLYRIIIDVLAEEGEQIRGIVERCDSPVRQKEGLPAFSGFYRAAGIPSPEPGHDAEAAVTMITENGITHKVDCLGGQKTGYFLDQRFNRAAAARICPGLRVLDLFCNIGGFSLNCAAAGAASVTGVDISPVAVAAARDSAVRNRLDGIASFDVGDVFALLTELAASGRHPYDFIILDPPAFTKSRDTVNDARRGYRDINYRAMRALPRGGYLATCSCSHFMTDELFRRTLAESAADADVSLRQVEARLASPDHPVLWGVPETEYLKFYIFQVV